MVVSQPPCGQLLLTEFPSHFQPVKLIAACRSFCQSPSTWPTTFVSLNFFCGCYSSNLWDLFHRLVQSSCLGRASQLGAVIRQISSVQLYLLCKCCSLKCQVRLVSQFVLDMTVPGNNLCCSLTLFLDTANNTDVLSGFLGNIPGYLIFYHFQIAVYKSPTIFRMVYSVLIILFHYKVNV